MFNKKAPFFFKGKKHTSKNMEKAIRKIKRARNIAGIVKKPTQSTEWILTAEETVQLDRFFAIRHSFPVLIKFLGEVSPDLLYELDFENINLCDLKKMVLKSMLKMRQNKHDLAMQIRHLERINTQLMTHSTHIITEAPEPDFTGPLSYLKRCIQYGIELGLYEISFDETAKVARATVKHIVISGMTQKNDYFNFDYTADSTYLIGRPHQKLIMGLHLGVAEKLSFSVELQGNKRLGRESNNHFVPHMSNPNGIFTFKKQCTTTVLVDNRQKLLRKEAMITTLLCLKRVRVRQKIIENADGTSTVDFAPLDSSIIKKICKYLAAENCGIAVDLSDVLMINDMIHSDMFLSNNVALETLCSWQAYDRAMKRREKNI